MFPVLSLARWLSWFPCGHRFGRPEAPSHPTHDCRLNCSRRATTSFVTTSGPS